MSRRKKKVVRGRHQKRSPARRSAMKRGKRHTYQPRAHAADVAELAARYAKAKRVYQETGRALREALICASRP